MAAGCESRRRWEDQPVLGERARRRDTGSAVDKSERGKAIVKTEQGEQSETLPELAAGRTGIDYVGRGGYPVSLTPSGAGDKPTRVLLNDREKGHQHRLGGGGGAY